MPKQPTDGALAQTQTAALSAATAGTANPATAGRPSSGGRKGGHIADALDSGAFAPILSPEGLVAVGFCLTLAGALVCITLADKADNSWDQVWLFHGAKIASTLAGASLIFLLLLKIDNQFVRSVGILFIADLIVPTSDIIRIAQIFNDRSEQRDPFVGSAAAVNVPHGLADPKQGPTGGPIIHPVSYGPPLVETLNQNGYSITRININQPHHSPSVVELIDNFFYTAHVQRIVTSVRQRGLERFVSDIRQEDHMRRAIAVYASDQGFLDDLDFLRTEGVISFLYRNPQTVQLTELGRAVLCYLNIRDHGEFCRSQAGGITLPGGVRISPPDRLRDYRAPTSDNRPAQLTFENGRAEYQMHLAARAGANYVRFRPTAPGNFTIRVHAAPNSSPDVDPAVWLAQAGEAQAMAYSDDDGQAHRCGSLISRRLESRDYVLMIRNVGDVAGEILIKVEQAPQ